MSEIVIVRVRGSFHLRKEIRDTLFMLGLKTKNCCVIKKSTPQFLGMVNKVKDFVTWGVINDETKKFLEAKGDSPYRLHPPRKGYGKKGIKVAFRVGGSLGDRGDGINDLIARMVPL